MGVLSYDARVFGVHGAKLINTNLATTADPSRGLRTPITFALLCHCHRRREHMTSYLEIAISNAENGWPCFPVQPDKRPYWGWTGWEDKASTSTSIIREWWKRYPNALPAVTPGRVAKTCVDVDRKPGKPDGWESLVDKQVHIPRATFQGRSLSGLGLHFWFRDLTSSVNGYLPGVDRKSRGGYVVTPYLMPKLSRVRVRVPLPLQGGKVGELTLGEPYTGQTSDWLSAHHGLTPSHAVQRTLRRFEGPNAEIFAGHELLLRVQTHLVLLAVDGHGGVSEALDRLATIWATTPHTGPEHPITEWQTALEGAINKHGGAKTWR